MKGGAVIPSVPSRLIQLYQVAAATKNKYAPVRSFR